jgi:hypothetical protein
VTREEKIDKLEGSQIGKKEEYKLSRIEDRTA